METVKELGQINLFEWFIILLLLATALVWIVELAGKVSKIVGKPFKWVQNKNKDHDLLLETATNLQELHDKHINDTDQSIRHDKMIRDDLSKLSIIVSELKEEIRLMRTQRDSDKLAEYKDKIGESYRYYHSRKYSDEQPIPYWNRMEKEALEGLISQYESHGGKNSFVHSVVEKEKDTWIIIE